MTAIFIYYRYIYSYRLSAEKSLVYGVFPEHTKQDWLQAITETSEIINQ